jgi:hypothetical protein
MTATPAIDQHDDNNPCKHMGSRQMKESEGERKERNNLDIPHPSDQQHPAAIDNSNQQSNVT